MLFLSQSNPFAGKTPENSPTGCCTHSTRLLFTVAASATVACASAVANSFIAGGSADATGGGISSFPGLDKENLPLFAWHTEEETLRASIQTGYESRRISSGMHSGYGYMLSNAEFEWYQLTAGIYAENPFDTGDDNPAGPFNPEYRFYANYAVALSEHFSASAGFTYYFLPRKGSTPNRHRELNLGVSVDLSLCPELIYNYDFDLRQSEVVLQISHEESLESWLPLQGFSLCASFACGYLHAERPQSDQEPTAQDSLSYIYTEIALDLSYSHNEHLSFYAGPRFAANDSPRDNIADRKSNFWWGIGCNVSF